eukprot:EG_transcript_19666
MSAEDKKYLSSHDLPMVVERMTCMLIADKPADPLGAMVQWLESQRRPTSTVPLKLYVFSVSANALQIQALIKDANIPLEVVTLNAQAGEHKAPEYVAKFPRGQVPALEDGDVYLEESVSILRYVANKFHLGDPWYPTDPVARWRVDRALDWRHSTLYPLLAKLAYPRIGFGAPISEAEQSAAAESLAKELEFFVTHVLKGASFVGGTKPSIADYSIAVTCVALQALPDLPPPKAFQEYLDRFAAASPNYAETVKALVDFIKSKQ